MDELLASLERLGDRERHYSVRLLRASEVAIDAFAQIARCVTIERAHDVAVQGLKDMEEVIGDD